MTRGRFAIFLLIALAGCAGETRRGPAALEPRPPLAEAADALPRLVGGGPEVRRINAELSGFDAQTRRAMADCTADPDHSFYERAVMGPMTGPDFLSLWVADFLYCGGPHPDTVQQALTYDLRSGAAIDWRQYLPASLVEPHERSQVYFDFEADRIRSPALARWFSDRVLATMDVERRGDCGDLFAPEAVESAGLMVWLDAREGGLAMQLASIAHASAACGESVVMPTAELRRRGADPHLVEAIESAHRSSGWRDSFSVAAD